MTGLGSRARRCVISDGRPPAQNGGRRHPERHFRRPDCRAGNWFADAVRLPRNRLRRFAHGWQLRLRLLLRLHQQPRVARPGDADATGDQSAPGVRAPLRRHRHQPGADVRARRLMYRRSILDLVGERTANSRQASARRTSASSTNISPRFAKSSSASSGPKKT